MKTEEEKINRDLYAFERVLSGWKHNGCGAWFSKTRQHNASYADSSTKRLRQSGYIVLDREVPRIYPERPKDNWVEFYYRPTDEGFKWWSTERTAQTEKKQQKLVDVNILAQPSGFSEPVIDGKGIGSTIRVGWYPHVAAAVKGIRDGYFTFEDYYWGHPSFWRMNEAITVSLTAEGMKYFDSLPRLQLECA